MVPRCFGCVAPQLPSAMIGQCTISQDCRKPVVAAGRIAAAQDPYPCRSIVARHVGAEKCPCMLVIPAWQGFDLRLGQTGDEPLAFEPQLVKTYNNFPTADPEEAANLDRYRDGLPSSVHQYLVNLPEILSPGTMDIHVVDLIDGEIEWLDDKSLVFDLPIFASSFRSGGLLRQRSACCGQRNGGGKCGEESL